MINFTTLKSNLYNWAIANVPAGMPVVYYFPNAPRPTVDYVSLYVSAFRQIDWDFVESPLADDGSSNYVGDREFTLQVQAYGSSAIQTLENLRTSLQKQTVLDSLRANGIVFFNWHDINDITDLIDSRYEIRGTMDLEFRIAQIYTDNSGVISQVQLEEIVKNVDDTTVYDETFLIPPTI